MGFWSLTFIVIGAVSAIGQMFRLIDWLERPAKKSAHRGARRVYAQ